MRFECLTPVAVKYKPKFRGPFVACYYSDINITIIAATTTNITR